MYLVQNHQLSLLSRVNIKYRVTQLSHFQQVQRHGPRYHILLLQHKHQETLLYGRQHRGPMDRMSIISPYMHRALL